MLRPGKNLKKFGEWAVVTGATDGIGEAMAIEMAKKGMSIVLISRCVERPFRSLTVARHTRTTPRHVPQHSPQPLHHSLLANGRMDERTDRPTDGRTTGDDGFYMTMLPCFRVDVLWP